MPSLLSVSSSSSSSSTTRSTSSSTSTHVTPLQTLSSLKIENARAACTSRRSIRDIWQTYFETRDAFDIHFWCVLTCRSSYNIALWLGLCLCLAEWIVNLLNVKCDLDRIYPRHPILDIFWHNRRTNYNEVCLKAFFGWRSCDVSIGSHRILQSC